MLSRMVVRGGGAERYSPPLKKASMGSGWEMTEFKNEIFPIQVEESRGSRVNDEADQKL